MVTHMPENGMCDAPPGRLEAFLLVSPSQFKIYLRGGSPTKSRVDTQAVIYPRGIGDALAQRLGRQPTALRLRTQWGRWRS